MRSVDVHRRAPPLQFKSLLRAAVKSLTAIPIALVEEPPTCGRWVHQSRFSPLQSGASSDSMGSGYFETCAEIYKQSECCCIQYFILPRSGIVTVVFPFKRLRRMVVLMKRHDTNNAFSKKKKKQNETSSCMYILIIVKFRGYINNFIFYAL